MMTHTELQIFSLSLLLTEYYEQTQLDAGINTSNSTNYVLYMDNTSFKRTEKLLLSYGALSDTQIYITKEIKMFKESC